MKRYFLVLVFIAISTITSYSQGKSEVPVFSATRPSEVEIAVLPNTGEFDSRIAFDALLLQVPYSTSVLDIANRLTFPLNTQADKVRSIYSWIALHINYDSSALSTGKVPDQSPEAVLERRNAVCEGYARLFVSMCQSVGIKGRMIKGFVREEGARFEYPNHAWNSVLIDGKWQLLDVTWGGLYYRTAIQANAGSPLDVLNTFCFPDPRSLVISHLPEDPYWQLQPNLVTLQDFMAGEDRIKSSVNKIPSGSIDFENLIASEEKLDSLDREINFLTRMVNVQNNGSREYALAITYYYKAQQTLDKAACCDPKEEQKLKSLARNYYHNALVQLEKLNENDFEFEFSRDFAVNLSQRMSQLQ